jgi:hypothetical protein
VRTAGLDAYKRLRELRLLGTAAGAKDVATRREVETALGPTLFSLSANAKTKELVRNLDKLWCGSRGEALERAAQRVARKEATLQEHLGEWKHSKEEASKMAMHAAKTAEAQAAMQKKQRSVEAQAKFDEWKAALKAGEYVFFCIPATRPSFSLSVCVPLLTHSPPLFASASASAACLLPRNRQVHLVPAQRQKAAPR